MITHPEPDALELEVKWVLGSITTNKASGGDGIPAELFHILKDDAMKVLHSVQFSSVAQSCPTLCDPMNCSTQASLSITNSRSSPKLMCIESVMPSSHLILCHPLLLLPSIPPNIKVFSSESTLHEVAKYWSFSLSISPSNEHPGLISFRMD